MNLKSEINVTPMVDVVLVLLIIFMVITPMIHNTLPVDPVKPTPGPPMPESSQITIRQDPKGEIWMNQEKIDISQLQKKLTSALEKGSRPVFYFGSDDISYGAAVRTLEAIHESGATQIGVVLGSPSSF
ncbi:MAG TPA: biopolymer transporter ExbD [Acidobacteriota bacterium]|nr:biopolymer transporter ExbD [Acidobacteriota bacterium]